VRVLPYKLKKEGNFMNKVILIGRLTRNPNVTYTQGNQPMCIARYSLAVDRRFKREGQPSADFINCVAMGKQGEFAEKYLKQGTKIAVVGRIQTGSYTNRDGNKVYTTDVFVEEQEFAESKNASQQTQGNVPTNASNQPPAPQGDGFMSIPDGIENELPFV